MQAEIITVFGSGGEFQVNALTGLLVTPEKERGLCPAPPAAAAPDLIDWTPRSMDSAPRDGTPILALCRHEADPYVTDDGKRLTPYGAHCEAEGHVPDGWHVVEWRSGREAYEGEHLAPSFLPGWWFLCASEGEMPANPVAWLPLPVSSTPQALPEVKPHAPEAA